MRAALSGLNSSKCVQIEWLETTKTQLLVFSDFGVGMMACFCPDQLLHMTSLNALSNATVLFRDLSAVTQNASYTLARKQLFSAQNAITQVDVTGFQKDLETMQTLVSQVGLSHVTLCLLVREWII